MAITGICPECGFHSPAQNRRCNCGYDLDKLQTDTPPHIESHASQISPPFGDSSLKSDDAQKEGATVQPEPTPKSYLHRHWTGELSLAQSYWVNMFALGFGSILLANIVSGESVNESLWNMPKLGALTVIAFWLALIAVQIWQWVGVWRSAENYKKSNGRKVIATLAQAAVVFGFILGSNLLVQTIIPGITEMTKIVIGLGDYGGYTVRVLNQGTEIEVVGGMAFGLTEEVERQLAANPQVRIIHLNSLGGRITEGQRLGRLIQSKSLITYSSRGCLSACTDAFLQGSKRVLKREARLGFHQPSLPGMAPASLKNVIAKEKKYLQSLGIEKNFIEKALSTPSSDMWMPSPEELLKANVITQISDAAQFARVP